MPMADRICVRRGTAASWTSTNPILTSGEPGLETDTGLTKIGDGATAWNSLAYDSVKLPVAFTTGSVLFVGTGDVISEDNAGISFDSVTNILTVGSIKDSALTSGRVVYATTAGLLTDSANLTWDGNAFVVNSPIGNYNDIFSIKNSGTARVTVRNDGYTTFAGLVSMAGGLTVTAGAVDFSAIQLVTSTVRGLNGVYCGPDGNNTVRLNRDADYILALNSFTNNSHTVRIYGGRTDASNYSRLSIAATSTSHTLSAEVAGTFSNADIVFTPAGSGKVSITSGLQLAGTGGTAASGITFGADTTLYRSAADTLKTDDSLVVVGTLNVGAGATVQKWLSATATLDYASIAAGAYEDKTITVTGAVSGDTVSIGIPNGSMAADLVVFGWVSAADTVTIRVANVSTTTARDPASGTWRATVIKF